MRARLVAAALLALAAGGAGAGTGEDAQLAAGGSDSEATCHAQLQSQQEACRALAAAASLLDQYQDSGGERLFGAALPWIEANAIESLADWALVSGGLDRGVPAPVAARLSAMLAGAFNNSYSRMPCHEPACGAYDDQAWWALAWLKSYELTGDDLYLLRAVEIFSYLAQPGAAWDESACDGGAWWSWQDSYKNSITNQLFFSLAAQLHQHAASIPAGASYPFPVDYFLDWAVKVWEWIEASELQDGSSGLFVDGLNTQHQENCTATTGGGNLWTYNQGVVLSGLAKLYEYSGDSSYLDTADSIVKAVLDHMTVPLVRNISSSAVPMGDEMVLVEIGCGQASCNDQQRMFAGAFMRHLGYLRRTVAGVASEQWRAEVYRRFAKSTADSSWWHARQPIASVDANLTNGSVAQLFGYNWTGPYQSDQLATSQIAAVALFASLLDDQPPPPPNQRTSVSPFEPTHDQSGVIFVPDGSRPTDLDEDYLTVSLTMVLGLMAMLVVAFYKLLSLHPEYTRRYRISEDRVLRGELRPIIGSDSAAAAGSTRPAYGATAYVIV